MQGLEKRFGVSKVVFEKLQVIYPGEKLQTTNKMINLFNPGEKTSDDELYGTRVYHHEKSR